MTNNIDYTLIDWSRAQFALTAMYHWIFVPLTLGLGFILGIMETIYVKTNNPEWKRITKFWMKLFGINFAIGIATGIILEFQFGTNWSNYSWFVGDIFGAPLAIEGIMAFFLESTFIVVMFFGWNKVSKKFHLASTWLTAIGANISALWILVANAWMQEPLGMHFNIETARNEMGDFWSVLLSPTAVNKYLHTVTSSYVLASVFVIGVSSWFLIKKRELLFAKRSILIAAVFGLLSSVFVIISGDGSAYHVTRSQPMKLAAMEGLYYGQESAGLVVVGALSGKEYNDIKTNDDAMLFKVEIPKLLSFMGKRSGEAFVPGVKDLVEGNQAYGYLSTEEKMQRGKIAISALREFKEAKASGNKVKADEIITKFNDSTFVNSYFRYFGYGYLNDPKSVIPNIPLTFYSFHIMVGLGFYFILLFLYVFYLSYYDKMADKKWLLKLALFSIPLPYIAQQCGWIVTELGRQPWVIQDLMPTIAAVSKIDASMVITTFILFSVFFTALLIAEINIMLTQIKSGPSKQS
jgi:cytochrome d ubiquinol oxidase subunit I